MPFYSYLFIRCSSTEDHITWNQEAALCVFSCLHILKAISSRCNCKLLCDCLRSIEAWVSVLDKTAVPEQEKKRMWDKMKQMVEESFEVVKKWLKKNVFSSSKIPWYSTTETEKELEVRIYLLFCSAVNNCETCRHYLTNGSSDIAIHIYMEANVMFKSSLELVSDIFKVTVVSYRSWIDPVSN